MREKTCCFTGHRQISPEHLPAISKKLKETLTFYIKKGYRYFGAGGALGFDTLAAQTVLLLKKQYPDIRLILVLPCQDQASRWQRQEIEEYERVKAAADKVVYTSDHYYNGCMHKRNRHLVDYSSLCICYLTNDSGGTKYTVDYALSRGLEVVNLAKK
jgi:uncharacterized phage-like protein YoqJ